MKKSVSKNRHGEKSSFKNALKRLEREKKKESVSTESGKYIGSTQRNHYISKSKISIKREWFSHPFSTREKN